MNSHSIKPMHVSLLAILAIAAFLRFYMYSEMSIYGDEANALKRLQYPTFREMIIKGALKDGHPVGVQSFLYYWTKCFGVSETSIRLPFVIAGILSVFILYLIGTSWFGPHTGLLSAITLAVLQFPVHYSRLARPYSFGLLFSLLSVWYLTRIAFKPEGKKIPNIGLYILFTTLSMYMHYFSFLLSFVAGLSGLIVARKTEIKSLILAGGACAVLFSPHFFINLNVLTETQGLGWLEVPDLLWIFRHIFFSFNESVWVTVAIFAVAVFLFSYAIGKQDIYFSRFHVLSLLFFSMPFLAGLLYSIKVKPVLQDRVLLFSLPFLLIFLFSCADKAKRKYFFFVCLFLVGATGISSTVFEKKYYRIKYVSDIKNIVTTSYTWMDRYGSENITKLAVMLLPDALEYYYQKYNRNIDFKVIRYQHLDQLPQLLRFVESSDRPYLIFAWATQWYPLELFPVIKKRFPYTIEKRWHYDSELYFFSRNRPDTFLPEQPLFQSVNDFESTIPYWHSNPSAVTDSISYSGKRAEVVGGTAPFSSTFSASLHDVVKSVDNIVFASVVFRFDNGVDSKLCISFTHMDTIYSWQDMPLSLWADTAPGEWKPAYLACRLPGILSADDKINIFVYNPSEKKVFIDDFTVWVKDGNPVISGERKDKTILRQ